MYHSELCARLYFWPFVDTSGGPDACWFWTGSRSNKRQGIFLTYGIVRVFGKEVLAHRYSLQLKLGEPLNKLFALHSCDEPRCCNPAHLRAGTAKDNSDDKTVRGRHRVNVPQCFCCVLSYGICACYECAAKAIGPGGIDDPEVLRLRAMCHAELDRRHEAALEAELLEEDYLDRADEYVSNELSLPRPTRPMVGPLMFQAMKDEEKATSFDRSWRKARETSHTCEGRGLRAEGGENGAPRSFGISARLGVQRGGCGAPAGEACVGTVAPPAAGAPPAAASPSPSKPVPSARVLTLRDLATLGAKSRGPLTEAQRATVLASLRAGYTLAETVAAPEVWRSAATVRRDARAQGWAAELAAAVQDGALVRGER